MRAGVEALEGSLSLVVGEDLHVSFLRDKLGIYEDIVGTLLASDRPRDLREALEYVERSKSRLLLDRVQTALEGRSEGRNRSGAEILDRLGELRAQLMRGYHQVHAMPEGEQRRLVGAGATTDQLAELEQSYRTALREFDLANLAEQGPRAPVVGVEAIQAALGTDETLVELYAVGGSLCAFVVTQSSIRVTRNVASVADVCFSVRRLRYNLQRSEMLAGYVRTHAEQILAGLRDALRQLYDLLLLPIADQIVTEKAVLVPHGVLHGVPFRWTGGSSCTLRARPCGTPASCGSASEATEIGRSFWEFRRRVSSTWLQRCGRCRGCFRPRQRFAPKRPLSLRFEPMRRAAA
jgi:hypothetical protein